MSYPRLSKVYDGYINLADGGLGSTLEDKFSLKIAHTPLWSTRAVTDDGIGQSILLAAHLEFLRAGARTLLTSTYQAAFNTFEREGYSREHALELMSRAVLIADKARSQYCAESVDVRPQEIHIVLSLCAFGGTVTPMQDYGGIYPAPYGPKAYTDDGENLTSFGDDTAGTTKSIRALAEFHTERILAYAENDQTWGSIDAIAFETLSLAREVVAVRSAVTAAEKILRGRGRHMKPWWITAVFPDGRCQETRSPGGDNIPAEEVAAAMIQDRTNDEGQLLVTPDGIGVNCTEIQFLPTLLDAFARAAQDTFSDGKNWPWIVLKPNGFIGDARTWADDLMASVKRMRGQGWGGVVVGGCCKATPDFIDALRSRISSL